MQVLVGRRGMVHYYYCWAANDMVVDGLYSVLVLLVSFYFYRIITKRLDASYPPSPARLPILGHLHLLGRLPHQALSHLSQLHGPLLFLRFGSIPALVANSPATAKLILHTHDKTFSGRPQNLTVIRNISDSPDIAFSLPDPFWKRMRQLCFSEFFSHKRLDYFKPLRAQEVRGLLLSIVKEQGKPIMMRRRLQATSMNLISRMVVGKSLEEVGAEIPNAENTMGLVLELFGMVGEVNLSDYIPWLAWLDLQGMNRKSKRLARHVNAIFQEVIERRRRSRSSDEPPRHFLDVLLLAALDSKNSNIEIKDANMRATIIDMFAAGSDTSSIAIEWTLLQLSNKPKKMKTLQEELERVVGSSRLVQECDLPNLPYLQAVVNESFRLHPSAPLLVPHFSLEDSQVCGYQVPKSSLVYVNAWAIHRDPSIWKNPSEFSPERFLDKNVDLSAQQCNFLPFGGGRRTCPGATLGRLSVQHILANLVHAFNWTLLAKPNFQEKFGLVVEPHEPFVGVPSLKLPESVFESLI